MATTIVTMIDIVHVNDKQQQFVAMPGQCFQFARASASKSNKLPGGGMWIYSAVTHLSQLQKYVLDVPWAASGELHDGDPDLLSGFARYALLKPGGIRRCYHHSLAHTRRVLCEDSTENALKRSLSGNSFYELYRSSYFGRALPIRQTAEVQLPKLFIPAPKAKLRTADMNIKPMYVHGKNKEMEMLVLDFPVSLYMYTYEEIAKLAKASGHNISIRGVYEALCDAERREFTRFNDDESVFIGWEQYATAPIRHDLVPRADYEQLIQSGTYADMRRPIVDVGADFEDPLRLVDTNRQGMLRLLKTRQWDTAIKRYQGFRVL